MAYVFDMCAALEKRGKKGGREGGREGGRNVPPILRVICMA